MSLDRDSKHQKITRERNR